MGVQTRDGVIHGCTLVLLPVALLCGLARGSVHAATGPVGDATIETTMNPPLANFMPGTPKSDNPAAGAFTGNPLWAVPLRVLSMTRERPLFSPSRRPAQANVAVTPLQQVRELPRPTEPDHPTLTLLGTIVGKTQSIGIFVDQVAKNVIRLKTGQNHGGWTLRAIQGREALFEKNQREAILVLPARNAADTGASVPTLIPAMGRPGDTWTDGDGQLIGPPGPQRTEADGRPFAPPPATWVDGDGQKISSPPALFRK